MYEWNGKWNISVSLLKRRKKLFVPRANKLCVFLNHRSTNSQLISKKRRTAWMTQRRIACNESVDCPSWNWFSMQTGFWSWFASFTAARKTGCRSSCLFACCCKMADEDVLLCTPNAKACERPSFSQFRLWRFLCSLNFSCQFKTARRRYTWSSAQFRIFMSCNQKVLRSRE